MTIRTALLNTLSFLGRMVWGTLRWFWQLSLDILQHNVVRPVRSFLVKRAWLIAGVVAILVMAQNGSLNQVLASNLIGSLVTLGLVLVGLNILTGGLVFKLLGITSGGKKKKKRR